jgi:hypothetical protein
MKSSTRLPLFLLTPFALVACLLGGGSDQPNRIIDPESNTITGKVIGGDGIAMVGARIRLYSGSYRTGPDIGLEPSISILDTEVYSDAMGTYVFRQFAYQHFMEIRSVDSTKIGIADSIPTDTNIKMFENINLSEGASIQGTLLSSSKTATLFLAGTHFRAFPDDGGRFKFPLIPPGTFRLVARMGSEFAYQFVPLQVLQLESGQALDLDTIAAEANQILLFNFDSEDRYNLLRGLSFPFYQISSSSLGSWGPLPMGFDTTTAYLNHSLHAKLVAKEQIGFGLGQGYYDLSKMTSLSFWAKGKGDIQVHFHSKLVITGMASFRATFTLTDTWTRYTLLAKDILVPLGSDSDKKGFTWDAAKAAVAKVTFETSNAQAELWIDEIKLEGMVHSDLGPFQPAGSDALQ